MESGRQPSGSASHTGRALAAATIPDLGAVRQRVGCKVPMDQGRGVVVGIDRPAVQMLGRQHRHQHQRDQRGDSSGLPAPGAH